MSISKNIIEIIQVQNSCREIIQELYSYDSRPNDAIRQNINNAKLDEAIHLEIIEYDSFDDELMLSADTYEYYKTRLGQNDETNIGVVTNKLAKLKAQLYNYNLRAKNESTQKELREIYKLLVQLPTLLKHNLHAIASSSIFAFKNEKNFEIKMANLKTSHEDIQVLMESSKSVDNFIDEQYNFFKSMKNAKISSAILRIKYNSVALEDAFRTLYEDIKNYINQTVKDGEFIKKLQLLKKLKDENRLYKDSNIEELTQNHKVPASNIKEKRIHPDDRIHDYIDTILEIIKSRAIILQDTKEDAAFEYDIEEKIQIDKALYNYEKLHSDFLAQNSDLISFLIHSNIVKEKLLGVFVRMIKNYGLNYSIEYEKYINIEGRDYLAIYGSEEKK